MKLSGVRVGPVTSRFVMAARTTMTKLLHYKNLYDFITDLLFLLNL